MEGVFVLSIKIPDFRGPLHVECSASSSHLLGRSASSQAGLQVLTINFPSSVPSRHEEQHRRSICHLERRTVEMVRDDLGG